MINSTLSATIETRVIEYLQQVLDNAVPDNLGELLREPPVVLCRNIEAGVGATMVAHLGDLGVLASFVTKRDAAEQAEQQASVTTNALPDEIEELRRQARQDSSRRDVFVGRSGRRPTSLVNALVEVNKELWIIFSMVAIAGLINFAVASHYLLLGLYTLPTIMAAFFFGRRQAVMTAFASVLLVIIVSHFSPQIFEEKDIGALGQAGQWYHIMSWGGMLILTAYAMGTLYEKNQDKMHELRNTYHGLLLILRHFISQDEYTENHCYRVSIYAAKIAARMGMSDEYIEDVRSAALLHDIGKLKVSRDILYKAAKLSRDDRRKIEKHVDNGAGILEPMQGSLGRILPMILGHHDKFDGSGYRDFVGEEISLGARILAVADVYDALVSDRPYRKAMSPFEVKEIIIKGKGKEFDPKVVTAFVQAFDSWEMEISNVIV